MGQVKKVNIKIRNYFCDDMTDIKNFHSKLIKYRKKVA